MGVGGHFWDLLKPYARSEGVDFLRNKRVAVDLSFWIVQHEAAIRTKSPRARSPHLRTTFFRTVSLFSKMGAFPLFVVDGEPSPLKAQARMERFFRNSGVDLLALPKVPAVEETEATPGKQRNQAFVKCVRECVELLELLGMPILRAHGEAEALCAQLNSEGHVDACITADSDAFLFGAKCVIKCLRSNSKEPFECYYLSDIEGGLGLRRKQMVAIALLVGNDHDLHGVPGFGVDTAVRFVKLFPEDEILDRLCEVGKGNFPLGNVKPAVDLPVTSSVEVNTTARPPHCSHCGHPGSKKAHLKVTCEYCIADGLENCTQKPTAFRCKCSTCDRDRRMKEQKKHENWQVTVCKKIAAEQNFPNKEIIEMYLSNNHGDHCENFDPSFRWDIPNVESLVDFLSYHQNWEPSYIRQRMLPMLSTFFLREMASNPKEAFLLCDQYEFHSIQRVKIKCGHPYYLVKWKRASHCTESVTYSISNEQLEADQGEPAEVSEFTDSLDEPDVPLILVDEGCWFLLTDENMDLVQAAFPEIVDKFMEEKRLKELKSKQKKARLRTGKDKVEADDNSESPRGIQLSITEFYRSTKVVAQTKLVEDPEKNSVEGQPKGCIKMSADLDKKISKSVKRRLLFE